MFPVTSVGSMTGAGTRVENNVGSMTAAGICVGPTVGSATGVGKTKVVATLD